MEHSSPEQTSTDLKLSDLKKVHKEASAIASEITPDLEEEKKPSTLQLDLLKAII